MAPRTSSSKGPKAKTATSHVRAPQQVRIIGGQYKRTPLPVVDADGLRPTSDRVRETVFNWLGQDLTGWRCADLFAGTGALGLEAASRGAALDARMVDIVSGDAFAWLTRQADGAFDAVFIDPPFAQDWSLRALEAAIRVVKPGGVIYLEAPQPLVDVSTDSQSTEASAGIPLPADVALHKHLRAGAVHAHLLLRKKG